MSNTNLLWKKLMVPSHQYLHRALNTSNFNITLFNTLRPRQNGRRFADDTFKRNFLNENVRISIAISLRFVPKGPINNIPALVQIMAWRRSGDKPLSEPMMVSLLTHICVTQPQWIKNVYSWTLLVPFLRNNTTLTDDNKNNDSNMDKSTC